jgi:polygalacturonase
VPKHQGQVVPREFKVTLNVRDRGAVGDGKVKDTAAIQETIDRCAVLGGGVVIVPAGDYSTGAFVLRSNVLLRLEKDASLIGTSNLADYPLTQVRWEGRWVKGHSALISAMDAMNFRISGKGRLIGNDAITGPFLRVDRITGFRYPALIEFTNCRNIRMEDCYTSQNGMWSIHTTYCENVRLYFAQVGPR